MIPRPKFKKARRQVFDLDEAAVQSGADMGVGVLAFSAHGRKSASHVRVENRADRLNGTPTTRDVRDSARRVSERPDAAVITNRQVRHALQLRGQCGASRGSYE